MRTLSQIAQCVLPAVACCVSVLLAAGTALGQESVDGLQQGSTQQQPMSDRAEVAVVSRGQAAFDAGCVQCHDAERSLSKSKTLSGWLSTVRRMAAKDGATVPPGDVDPIAQYLASLPDSSGGETLAGAEGDSQWSFSATVSPLWRGSSDAIENAGFFPDAWIGGHWQSRGPISATVTVCTSCHSDQNSGRGFTLEFVEASATIDLVKALFPEQHAETRVQAELKAGRFVVPFGAFSALSHPGAYRTLTNPLMFNMGRRVASGGALQPVLPMPYADEGANLHLAAQVHDDSQISTDFYAVNGLQAAGPGANFDLSRSYVDNNREPAVGGRAKFGGAHWQIGASVMSGQMHDEGATPRGYHIMGADAILRGDLGRAYFEYALRRDDPQGTPVDQNDTYGIVIETELNVTQKISLLTRYDTLEHRHVQAGEMTTERMTWGFNFLLPNGSLLLVNHEHWMFPDAALDIDIIGMRWTSTF